MRQRINVSDFDLAGTLECGQAFRWRRDADGWFTGVVGKEVWRLQQADTELEWSCSHEPARGVIPSSGEPRAGSRLQHYLALDVPLREVVATFPDDEPLHAAVRKHWGLRVLRQEPWETLASFIASSTKQIVQIRQIVAALADRFGENNAFPTVDVIARATHRQLLDCKLGFRAKYLLAAAQMIDRGEVWLDKLPAMEYERALEELMKLPGVGEKIAACTLLFSCGHDEAFPIDVWVERSLRRLYFIGQKVTRKKLRDFTHSHFGPYAGWAQQYLFFSERARGRQPLLDVGAQ
jgi:N-glycosylase/DNA lyase